MSDKLTLQQIAHMPIRDALLHLALMEGDDVLGEPIDGGMPGVVSLVATVMSARVTEPSLIPAACLTIA